MGPVDFTVLGGNQRHQFRKPGRVINREPIQAGLKGRQPWIARWNLVDRNSVDLGHRIETIQCSADVFPQYRLAGVPLRVSLLQGAQGLELLECSKGARVASLRFALKVVPGSNEVLARGRQLQLLCYSLTSHLGPGVFLLLSLDVTLA